jgi:hypothetical protein
MSTFDALLAEAKEAMVAAANRVLDGDSKTARVDDGTIYVLGEDGMSWEAVWSGDDLRGVWGRVRLGEDGWEAVLEDYEEQS